MRELMNGTCLLNEAGVAKKTGFGWKVKSSVGNVFTSIRHGAKPGEKTDTKFVDTKKEARDILKLLETTHCKGSY